MFVTAHKQISADMLKAIQQSRSRKALPTRLGSGKSRGLCRPERGESLLRDLDAIDEVGGLSKAGRRDIAKLFVVQNQPFPHDLGEL